MAKLIIILGLILSLGGMVFAQVAMPPGVDVPAAEVEVVPEEEKTIVEILRIMFPEAIIEVEPITGALIVSAPPALQKRIEETIRRLDVYHPQIAIETKFVELRVTDINELGVDLDILNIKTGPTLDQGDIDIITDWGDPAEMIGTTLQLTRLSPTDFTLVLRAMEEQGRANVLSAPRVTTLNRQPATIEIRRGIPYVTEVEIENVGTAEFPRMLTTFEMGEEEEGIFLEVTPTVPEGSSLITLDVRPTVRTLIRRIPTFPGVAAEHGWPIMEERTAHTSLTVRSGETIVLGGLIRSRTETTEKRVPFLGDIPLLGWVFRHTHSREVKGNLLIFITAYLVSPCGERIVGGR